jgi:porin
LFVIGELDFFWGERRSGRLGLGAWHHTGSFDRFDGGAEDGTQGAYLVLDQHLWCADESRARCLSGFLQVGVADPEVSPSEAHLGAGLHWSNPFAPELNDALGLGLSGVRLSDEAGAGFDEREEVAIEAFYGFEPLSWLHLKPTVQYVVNPGGDSDLDDALVLTLRTTVSL